ncbi:putative N-acetyltransferase YjaB [Falsiruegeria litorea R37]|uniref:Putative N-acetyltransferase YjaB n=1 Tax=Falsiruegeria litorea R37 TaxID=1200284 RepID=A0A1Y5T1N2_9RHOB|nr:GNAT family N-acetyltransferase [Falsiruegeria litorea]SLN54094.1 putative N-acetyltransferase YjaB [Falsiruegeria litorea R37]
MIIRAAHGADAGAIGAILSAFIDDTPWMPRIHTRAEDLSFAGLMVDRGWVRVAERDRVVVGFLALNEGFVHSLYMQSDVQGQGGGKALLDDAKASSERLALNVFQANTDAQRFYQREGFVETGRGDGTGNDENLPDITYVWTRTAKEEPQT